VSRLLVVDDDIQMLSALEAALRHKGHTVETASNGIDAASKLENSASGVQAVITDLKMPGMDGIELLQSCPPDQARNTRYRSHGVRHCSNCCRGDEGGRQRYLVKPFSHQALDEILSKHVVGCFSPRSSSRYAEHEDTVVLMLD